MAGDSGDGRHRKGEEVRNDAAEELHHPEKLRLGGVSRSGSEADGLRVAQVKSVGEETTFRSGEEDGSDGGLGADLGESRSYGGDERRTEAVLLVLLGIAYER